MIKHLKKLSHKLSGSNLPYHRKCEDCENYDKCKSIYSNKLKLSKQCRWSPNAFKLNKEEDEVAFVFYLLYFGKKTKDISKLGEYFKGWKNIVSKIEDDETSRCIVDMCYCKAKAIMKIVRENETRQKNKEID